MSSPGVAVNFASSLSIVNFAVPVKEYSTLSLLLTATGSKPEVVAVATLTTVPKAPLFVLTVRLKMALAFTSN